MATSVACCRPSAPIMRQYIQLMGSTAALPSGARADARRLPGTPTAWRGRAGRAPGLPPRTTGPTPGPPPPCGMQKVLCRFRWLTSPPNSPGAASAHQCVHVGAVHIDPAAVLVHQRAQLFDRGFEHAVGAGVGDHHRGQVGAVLLALGLQVGHVHVAVVIALGRPPPSCRPSWRWQGWCRARCRGSGRCCGGPGRGPRGRP